MTGEAVNYSYDSLNRLSAASGAGWGNAYTYDGFGNLTDKTVTAGSAPSWHALVSATKNRITTAWYDANGNTGQTPDGAIYGYDSENRMTGGGGEGYAYGPDNLRVWKLKTDGTDELHVYGAYGELVGTYPIFVIPNPNGTPTGSYGIGGGTTNLYFAGKRLGSVDRLESNGGNFYPYGEEYTTTAQNTFKFTTYYRDATTLDYAKNRYYSSAMGRFMSADPYRNSAGPAEPGSWNRYAYTRGDPANRFDPGGLCDQDPNYSITVCSGGLDPLETLMMKPWFSPATLNDPSATMGRAIEDNQASILSKLCDLAPDGRTVGLNGAIGVLGGVSVSSEVVLDYHTGQAILVISAGFGPSGAAAQIGASTGFIAGKGNSVPNYASGGNTTISASLPSGLGISVTANSGGLTGNPAALKPLSATAVQIGYSVGLVSLLGGFGAFAQNTILQIPLGSFLSGPAAALTIPADGLLNQIQTRCDTSRKP